MVCPQVDVKVDWQTLKTKRDNYILRLNNIYQSNLEKSSVDLCHGWARFVDDRTIVVGTEKFSRW